MGKRVLLVEDDASLTRSIVEGLSDEGFAVAHAADGDAALAALGAGDWDLVILDWWLPGPDGLEVLGGHHRQGGTTPVLFLTARDAVSDRVRGLDGGADDYLCKPFAFDELLARARALIRRGRPVEVTTISYRDVRVDLAVQRAGHPLGLTANELALLTFFLSLFLARADAEAGLPDLEHSDLAAWAADHLRTWSGHERAADLRFEGCDGEPCWTRAHRPLLGQLLDNLLENACKYSEAGTPIVVRTWCEPDAVALTVEDCGCGIPSGDLPRVFEPFYRAESARRLGRAGVRLGLAVARRIAVTHEGTITAESEPGRGSRCVVRLPRAPAPDVAPAIVDGREAVAPTPD